MSEEQAETTAADQAKTGPAELESAIEQATEAVAVESQVIDELADTSSHGEPIGMASLMDVPVRVTVEVGRTRIPLAELVELGPGSLVVLDREAHEPADILVNGKVVARGEVVTMDGNYGVRITDVQK